MAKTVVTTQSDRYATGIFLYSAVPLIKVICESEPQFGDKFKGKSFVFQVSAKDSEAEGTGKLATHFVINDGVWTTFPGVVHEKPDVELAFPSLRKFVVFFSGKGMPLPKIKGLFKFGLLIPLLGPLLRMAKLMQSKDKPTLLSDQIMLCKLFLYLLPSGISRLNKMGHPDVKAVTETSPDRAYALIIENYPDLQSWIRVKGGKSMSGRGEYKRCKPFLAMKFKDPSLALDILMSKADMVKYIELGNLFVDGAPEFAGTVGALMFKVAYYAQGQYLDVEK